MVVVEKFPRWAYVKYEINGRIYMFKTLKIEDGYLTGYCSKLKKRAVLLRDCIQAEGDPIMRATLIEKFCVHSDRP